MNDTVKKQVQDQILEALIKSEEKLNDFKVDDLRKIVFNNSKTLSLSLEGCLLLKRHYQAYEYSCDKRELSMKDYLNLSRKIKYPFYLTNQKFILFSEFDAFTFNIYGNDLSKWLDSKD